MMARIAISPDADLVAIASKAGNSADDGRYYEDGFLVVTGVTQEALEAAVAQVGTEPPKAPRIRVIRALAFRERLSESRRADLSVAAMASAAAGSGTLLTFLMDQAAAQVTDLDNERVQAGVKMLLAAGLISQEEHDALLADGTPEEAA